MRNARARKDGCALLDRRRRVGRGPDDVQGQAIDLIQHCVAFRGIS